MNKIPTAVEIFRKNMDPSQPIRGDVTESLLRAMIEFAKLHIKAQAEKIYEELQSSTDLNVGQLESILSAYPLILIE